MNLKSSTNKQGKYHTQIIQFTGGVRKTCRGVDASTIEQGQFTKFMMKDGRMMLINDANVLWIEVHREEEDEN
tara:strand:+ start:176 stop:394 length:219 start_codon:yes stop_codon:yes gene_type:complete